MKVFLMLILFCFTLYAGMSGKEVWANSTNDNRASYKLREAVHIGPNGVTIPLGRMTLIRKGTDYCALKFTEIWIAKTREDTYKGKKLEGYSRYEVYYQGDGTGNFSNANVKYDEDELIQPYVYGFRPFIFQFGRKTVIRCGPIRLVWVIGSGVHFYKPGQSDDLEAIMKYGIELAPTPWTRIEEVDITDPRIQWYKYDLNRPEKFIHIDQLWPEKQKGDMRKERK